MSALDPVIKAQIEQNGPMTLAEYMSICLLHPEHGYYATRDPFGAQGDFTTAPEISQMFGEMIGLCLAQTWMDQGAPPHFVLAEIGPGRGTLMADMLRATRSIPGFAPEVHLIEASPTLREVQRATLKDHQVTWHDTVSTLPQTPLFLVANEFFDALPIRQFTRAESGWSETLVGLKDGILRFGRDVEKPVAALDHRLVDTKPGNIVELCPALPGIVAALSVRLKRGGAAILIDYGDWRSLGDTLQALKSHKPVDPLTSPGDADLTAHVDFEALARAADCATSGMTTQGVILERLGITARAQALAQRLSGSALDSHIAAHRRLTHPDEMGTLFKALALYSRSAPPPPGFD